MALEVLFGLFVIIFIAVFIIKSASSLDTTISGRRVGKEKMCEIAVSNQLRKLDSMEYYVFDNLVLPSRGNTPHTEIDHLIMSPYGIFCVETKSDRGSIYGSLKKEVWKKYLYGKEYIFPNPFRQNYKHIRAIEDYFGLNLKSPVHSYVVFPNADKVRISGKDGLTNINEVIRLIGGFRQKIYNIDEFDRMINSLKFMSIKRFDLLETHKEEVQAYLKTKIS